MQARLLILTGIFLVAAGFIGRAARPEVAPAAVALGEMPMTMGAWVGREAAPFADEVIAVAGVDEYINRVYRVPGSAAVGLYVGYYASQRQGDSIHSPLNCLPGAGWQPITTTRVPIAVPGRDDPVVVNRVLIQKGLDRQVALYWYMSHGRVAASEYAGKAYLIYDAIRYRRSDAALVRIVSPVLSGESDDAVAGRRGIEFAQALFPSLEAYLPF